MMRGFRIAGFALATCFLLTSCGGGGGSSFLGGTGSSGTSGGSPSGATSGKGNVQFTLRIPGAGSSSSATSSTARIVSATVRKPQTISSQTQSITVSVNGGTPQIFNVSSCTGSPNLTCVLSVGASYGLDSFLILTYSGPNGSGTALNAAALTIDVTQGGSNSGSATAGNLITVNSNGDGSGGSNSCAAGSTTCTLREAVAEASTTAGVYTALLFSGVTSITVQSPITINGQSIIILGPGALSANTNAVGAPSASSNLTISGGGATQIISVQTGSLLVDGVTLSGGNSSDTTGGAIENYGSLAIANTIFTGNGGTSTQDGGAVWDAGATPSTIAYSTFTNNTSTSEGGAYYIDSGASFSNVLFNGNVAFDGSSYGAGGAIYAENNLNVNNSTFTANTAGSTSVSNTYGYGGAIDIDNNSTSPTITNSTFGGSSSSAGNFAGGPGANAEGEGGAIYNDGGNPLTISGNSFSNNTVKGGSDASGGAISDYYGVNSTNDTFTNNTADATAAMSGCSMYAYGGAVYTDNDYYQTGSNWTSDTFSGNQGLGTLNGSAYVYGGALFDYYGGGITVTGSTFKSNTANGGVYLGVGGGLAVEDSYGSATLTNDTFTSNVATAQSGQVYGGGVAVDYSYITFSGLTFSNNSATIIGTTTSNAAYGGGFEFYDGDDNQEKAIARRPSPDGATHANAAAELAKHAARTFEHAQAKFLAHVAKKSKHAATRVASRVAPSTTTRRAQIVVSNGSSTITSTSLTGNIANAGSGGYAYGGGADLSGAPVITATTITGNSATASGSGGYAVGGGLSNGSYYCGESPGVSFTGTISGNSAINAGGGIWNDCSDFTVLESTVSGNKVTAVAYDGDGGGGIYSDCESIAITQTTISGNSVAGTFANTGGGGLMNYDGNLTITNSTVASNTSADDGGGVENGVGGEAHGTLTLVNATIYQNSATGHGGSVENLNADGENYIYLENTILAGGSASSGNDVDNQDTFVSYGGNLIQGSVSGNAIPAASEGIADLTGVNPVLGSLADNGGPTSTIADTSSSPGKGHIPYSGTACGYSGPTVDQRNYLRGTNGVCDIGAYEFNGTAQAQNATRSRTSSIGIGKLH